MEQEWVAYSFNEPWWITFLSATGILGRKAAAYANLNLALE